jgi:hypothetical protein
MRFVQDYAGGIRGFHHSIPFTTSRSHLPEGGLMANPSARSHYVRVSSIGSTSLEALKLKLLKFVSTEVNCTRL